MTVSEDEFTRVCLQTAVGQVVIKNNIFFNASTLFNGKTL